MASKRPYVIALVILLYLVSNTRTRNEARVNALRASSFK